MKPLTVKLWFDPEIVLVALLCCSGCGSRSGDGGLRAKQPVKEEFLVMGTFASVSVPAAERERLRDFVPVARDMLQDLENMLSVYRQESEICRIAEMSGKSPVPVSDDTYRVLALSKKYAALSDGAFDVTVGPLMSVWGFRGGAGVARPSEELIRSTLERVGCDHLILSNRTAYLEREGMQIDVGGIAKGYAVDLCYERLVGLGASNILVDLGGNIRCLGFARRNRPWRVGVKNPFSSDPGSLIGTLTLTDGMATATSGNYERFVEIGGERYAHIMDPRTGCPVKGMAGVTVVCSTATQADAMSTALFVLGMEKGVRMLAESGDCAALFIPDRQPLEIWITGAFRRYFEPLEGVADRVRVIGGG